MSEFLVCIALCVLPYLYCHVCCSTWIAEQSRGVEWRSSYRLLLPSGIILGFPSRIFVSR